MVVQLTQQEVFKLKSKGYSDEQIQEALDYTENEELEQNYNSANNYEDSRDISHSAFSSRVSDDIARWQLELDDILERAEHMLKGDIIEFKNGKKDWKDNPNPKDNVLSKEGVQICMKFLSLYINRNTILSDYTQEEIQYKVLDFGHRFKDLVFTKHFEMGMNDEDKMKEYASLVGAMVDVVHSAYARAKDGRERESYRKMISVSQASNGRGDDMGYGNVAQQQKTRGLLNPMRYVAGKYV